METTPVPVPDLSQIQLGELRVIEQIDVKRAWKYLARKFEMDITGLVENNKGSKTRKEKMMERLKW